MPGFGEAPHSCFAVERPRKGCFAVERPRKSCFAVERLRKATLEEVPQTEMALGTRQTETLPERAPRRLTTDQQPCCPSGSLRPHILRPEEHHTAEVLRTHQAARPRVAEERRTPGAEGLHMQAAAGSKEDAEASAQFPRSDTAERPQRPYP
jgi:hypothetical protein